MKHLVTILCLMANAVSFGQAPAAPSAIETARDLYETGNAHAAANSNTATNQALALGKYRSSLRILDSLGERQSELIDKNASQIKKITDFFSQNKNSDSLLQLTRFYPDSLFQKKPKYSDRFKQLMPKFLNDYQRIKRDDFFRIKNLNYIRRSSGNGNRFILDFERYWPLEIIDLEKELQLAEEKLNKLPRRDKEELIYSIYDLKYKNVKKQLTADSLRSSIKNIQQSKEKSEAALKTKKEQFDRYKKIGIAAFLLLFLSGLYAYQKNKQQLKNINQNLLEEKKRAEELLLNMLPAEIARELKNKAAARAHKYERVSILFSDFQGFSQIAKNLTPEELVLELDYCFTEFDRIIDKYRLQKIKTIGDAYMCVGGLYTKGTSHVKRMVMAALEIQAFLNNLKERRTAAGKHFFEARIGIHTGPIVAGVVGTKKFAFDIWGDSVNVAQQMEFHSETGKVNISGETFALIQHDFNCTYHRKVVVKNNRAFEMYFVDSLKK